MKRLAFILFALLAACSSAPEMSDDPLADVAPWQMANAELERHYEATALPPSLDVPAEGFQFVLQGKLESYKEVREELRALYDTNNMTLRSAATLRMAQLDLNLSCELMTMEAPEDFEPAAKELIAETIFSTSKTVLVKARRGLEQSARMGDNEYARAAQRLADDFPKDLDPEVARTYCQAHREAWYREPSVSFALRMKAACEAGRAEACYVSSRLTDDEALAAEHAEIACTNGVVQACPEPPANALGELGSLPATCAEGKTSECWREAITMEKEKLPEYTTACLDGSGFDCFKRGLLLEKDDALLDTCLAGGVPDVDPEKARTGCKSGDVKACFQLGAATYSTPKIVEESTHGSGGVLSGVLGRLTTPDSETLRERCERMDGPACARLAWTYDGDSSDRVKYLNKACDLKHQVSCTNLARHLRDNDATPDGERKRAVKLLRGACKAGETGACNELFSAHLTGTDVAKSHTCAARFLFQTCTADSPYSCHRLGELK